MELVATCGFGLEKLVYNELKKLGLWVIKTEDGRVTFEGSTLDMIRANLWLRTAGRVHIKMSEFTATTFDELFEQVSSLPWEQYIGNNDVFPMHASSAKSVLHSEPAIQSIVKKAIVKRLQSVYQMDKFPENSNAVYQVRIHINKDNVLLSIDTSGESLHKRGFRPRANEAPLRETLAAALVTLSDWTPDRPLVDPFCGSGTIAIEAAMIACNIAPGLRRTFAFQQWSWIDPSDMAAAYKEAREARSIPENLRIYCFDRDGAILKVAQDNVERAGLEEFIHFKHSQFQNLDFSRFEDCTFIANPPYGERLEEVRDVEIMYEEFGRKFRLSQNCSLYIITSVETFPQLFGRKADKNRKLFNGKLRTYVFSFERRKT